MTIFVGEHLYDSRPSSKMFSESFIILSVGTGTIIFMNDVFGEDGNDYVLGCIGVFYTLQVWLAHMLLLPPIFRKSVRFSALGFFAFWIFYAYNFLDLFSAAVRAFLFVSVDVWFEALEARINNEFGQGQRQEKSSQKTYCHARPGDETPSPAPTTETRSGN